MQPENAANYPSEFQKSIYSHTYKHIIGTYIILYLYSLISLTHRPSFFPWCGWNKVIITVNKLTYKLQCSTGSILSRNLFCLWCGMSYK